MQKPKEKGKHKVGKTYKGKKDNLYDHIAKDNGDTHPSGHPDAGEPRLRWVMSFSASTNKLNVTGMHDCEVHTEPPANWPDDVDFGDTQEFIVTINHANPDFVVINGVPLWIV